MYTPLSKVVPFWSLGLVRFKLSWVNSPKKKVISDPSLEVFDIFIHSTPESPTHNQATPLTGERVWLENSS